MNLVPRWARPVAVIGLRLQALQIQLQLGDVTKEEAARQLFELRREIQELPP